MAPERTRPSASDGAERDFQRDFDRLSTRRIGTAPSAGQRAFVAAAIASCFALLGAVLSLNTIVDPFAIAGTRVVPAAVETDRAIKLTLLERLERGPEILILGSSRARQAEPAFLRRLTGRRGFNAGVTAGTAADAYVFTRFAADRFPGQRRRYVWFVDVGIATNGINPQLADEPRAQRYLAGSGRFRLRDVGTYLTTRATRASLRVMRNCVIGTCRAPIRGYRADGSLRYRTRKISRARARKVREAAAEIVAKIRRNPPGRPNVNPERYEFFERALAFMNAQGARPVIVLNPRYPTILAELKRHGYPRRRAAIGYLRRLRARYDFVFVDAEDVRTWSGTARDFTNVTHVDWRNMRRLLRYVVARSEGALRLRAPSTAGD